MFWRLKDQFVDFQHAFPPSHPHVPSFDKFCQFFDPKNWENFGLFFLFSFGNFYVKPFISQNWKEKPCSPQKNIE